MKWIIAMALVDQDFLTDNKPIIQSGIVADRKNDNRLIITPIVYTDEKTVIEHFKNLKKEAKKRGYK